MRRDVKRFLLLWPAITSITIIGLSILMERNVTWQSVIGDTSHQRPSRTAGHKSWEPPILVELAPNANERATERPGIHLRCDPLHDVVAPTPNEVTIQERAEHGSRAMQVPERISNTLGINRTQAMLAPLRDELQELAGYVLQPPRIASDDEDLGTLSADLFDGDILAAERIANQDQLAADRELGINTLERVRPLANAPIQSNLLNAAEIELPADVDELLGIARKNEPTTEIAVAQPAARPPSVMPKSIANLAKIIPRSIDQPPAASVHADSNDAKDSSSRDAAVARNRMQGNPATWPLTPRLHEQLETLSIVSIQKSARAGQLVGSRTASESVSTWSAEVTSKLTELRALPRLGEPVAGQLLSDLSELAKVGYRNGENATDREEQIHWLVAAHAISRRIAIWNPIWQTVSAQSASWSSDSAEIATAAIITPIVERVNQELDETGDAAGWKQYLMLSAIIDAASQDVAQRTIVAQRVLSRLSWHGLDPSHREWLNRPSVNELAAAIQPWSRSAVDYASLLSQIERQESDAIDLTAVDIAGAVQALRFADNPKANDVATAIETYYRNANVRIALSQELMTRMLPTIDPTSAPVRTTMFGSRVRGVSEIHSDLEIDLEPSRDRWSLTLRTLGDIRTQSVGEKGSTAVSTRGSSVFSADTPVQITLDGVQVGDSVIDVRGSTRLRGVSTNFDGWPLLGGLVRSIAASRFQDRSPMTSRIANRRIRTQLSREIDTRVGERMELRSKQFSDFVMGPLSGLQLDPKVVDMNTTEDRLVARYRLAGDWQIGAFTPRPRAPSDSLLSLQVNQSAFNNTLEQIVPLETPTTIEAAVNKTMTTFGFDAATMPEDIPEDVMIQFTKTRPVTVEIEDGLAWVTLRVVELSKGKKFRLKRFIVRAAYRPQLDGLNVAMVRDGHLRISGPGMTMRQRLPIRAIFNKVLSPNRAFPLTQPEMVAHVAMENARVSQMELRDGWMALAFSDKPQATVDPSNDRVAKEAAESSQR